MLVAAGRAPPPPRPGTPPTCRPSRRQLEGRLPWRRAPANGFSIVYRLPFHTRLTASNPPPSTAIPPTGGACRCEDRMPGSRPVPVAGGGRRGCDCPRGRQRHGEDVGVRHLRDRQLVHDQDRRPAAGVRPDGVDRRSRDLRHPLHLQGRRSRPPGPAARLVVDGDVEREDVHVQAQEERPLRRRDAAHVGRRRLLAAAPRQPEGQPGVPARRRHGRGGRQVRGRDALEDSGQRSSRRSSRTRRRRSSTRRSSSSTAAPTPANAAKTDKAEQWLNSPASAGAGSGPYIAHSPTAPPRRSRWCRTRATGARRSRRSAASSSAT